MNRTALSPLRIRTHNKYRSLTVKRAYGAGEIICPIPSESLYDKPNQFTVQIGIDQHIEVKELASMNHACDPSVILDTTRMLVFAARDLQADDELRFFYPSTEWEMSSPFICLCGAANCIHVVAGARFLPVSTLEGHFLNYHIRHLMVELLNKTERHLGQLEAARKAELASQRNPAVT
ncbi:MAG: SET domain-containing protein-lysine N-methyltransferase [Chloroflexota bacterium]